MFDDVGRWYAVKQTDPRAVALYKRHYSAQRGDRRHGIAGPGQTITLLTNCAKALFVWRTESWIGASEPHAWWGGVACSVFRNESEYLSSELIGEAVEIAWRRWPRARLYTTVNPSKVQSANPGYCFKMAGWSRCSRTLGGLEVLELLPPTCSLVEVS